MGISQLKIIYSCQIFGKNDNLINFQIVLTFRNISDIVLINTF